MCVCVFTLDYHEHEHTKHWMTNGALGKPPKINFARVQCPLPACDADQRVREKLSFLVNKKVPGEPGKNTHTSRKVGKCVCKCADSLLILNF